MAFNGDHLVVLWVRESLFGTTGGYEICHRLSFDIVTQAGISGNTVPSGSTVRRLVFSWIMLRLW